MKKQETNTWFEKFGSNHPEWKNGHGSIQEYVASLGLDDNVSDDLLVYVKRISIRAYDWGYSTGELQGRFEGKEEALNNLLEQDKREATLRLVNQEKDRFKKIEDKIELAEKHLQRYRGLIKWVFLSPLLALFGYFGITIVFVITLLLTGVDLKQHLDAFAFSEGFSSARFVIGLLLVVGLLIVLLVLDKDLPQDLEDVSRAFYDHTYKDAYRIWLDKVITEGCVGWDHYRWQHGLSEEDWNNVNELTGGTPIQFFGVLGEPTDLSTRWTERMVRPSPNSKSE